MGKDYSIAYKENSAAPNRTFEEMSEREAREYDKKKDEENKVNEIDTFANNAVAEDEARRKKEEEQEEKKKKEKLNKGAESDDRHVKHRNNEKHNEHDHESYEDEGKDGDRKAQHVVDKSVDKMLGEKSGLNPKELAL